MGQKKHFKIINFFSLNKFLLGLFSVIYIAVIVFFILLAVILSLKKYGKIRIIDLIIIGVPAWGLVTLVLVTSESGRWWLYPHWLFTAFKRVVVDIKKREINFITGFWPFLFKKKYAFDFIDSLVLTSRTIGDFGKEERFGLEVKLKNNDQWIFFTLFTNEQEFRITEIARQQMELFSYRLVLISDQLTLKVNDLNRDMVLYLEETIPLHILRKRQ